MICKKLHSVALFLLFFFCIKVNGQNINNNLIGCYKATSDSLLYSYFIFDNNGKVDIMGAGSRDFFIKGDSLILFPDKDVFKFRIENNKLSGVSDWVKNGTWIKQDTLVEDKRVDDAMARNKAMLLSEYYEKTRKSADPLEMLFNENAFKEYGKAVEDLCSRGLGKACLEWFGVKTMNELGGLQAILNPQGSGRVVKENPEMLALAHRIIEMGEVDGHALLGGYLYLTGKKEQGIAELEKASELGSKQAALTLMNLELAEMENKKEPEEKKKD